MKTLPFVLVLLAIVLMINTLSAQSGWVQTQMNANTGYSLYETDSVVYASTYYGVLATTGDGMPWFSKGPANRAVYDAIQTSHSILAATVDGIYRSTDKGNTWQLATNTINCSGVGGTQGHQVFTKNSSYIFAHTWAQGLFRSGDDGKTWQKLTVGTYGGWSGDLGGWATCIYNFGGKIFLGAPGATIGIYYSSNNGDTWSPAHSTDSSGASNLLFFYADHDTIYAGGFMGLYRSIDSGSNWMPRYLDVINPDGLQVGLGIFRDLVAYGQNLVAAVDFHSIQRSRDGGKTWTSFNDGLISDWSFADLAIKPPYIWGLTGFFGNAYRRSLSEIITEVKPALSAENANSLEQNCPNPVRMWTKIKYTVGNSGMVSLRIFDVFGKEVATLANAIQSPGTYELQFNAQNLSGGTYFYQLNTGDFAETRKFVVIR